jgi:hypothetical protein
MRLFSLVACVVLLPGWLHAEEKAAQPLFIARPDAFQTLVNPNCSHCVDEAKRRAKDLRDDDAVLCWLRGYYEGGAIPHRFFLNPYRVISDSYGVFVYDADAGYSRGFAPSYLFTFHGWRNGVMVMRHKDGTLFSCLSGVAFDGPRKGQRLTPVPTLVSTWGEWMQRYPDAVTYHMFDKYQPVELLMSAHEDSVKTRAQADPRLPAQDQVLGVWTGKTARAYPIAQLEKEGFLRENFDGMDVVVLWDSRTRTASAFRPIASQPRKYKGPQPNEEGVSPPNPGEPLPKGTQELPPRKLTLGAGTTRPEVRAIDRETKSSWDIAGRAIDGEMKGWTLEWVDSVQCQWFAWAAEYPATTIYAARQAKAQAPTKEQAENKVKEVAGTAEFLRVLPKPFATLQAIDPARHTVTLLLEGEKVAKVWPIEPDAEIKIAGWWGRLEQFKPGQRVWVWLKLDRKKNPIGVAMLADEASEQDIHTKGPADPAAFERSRGEQRAWLRARWETEGLPASLTFHHLFSGEMEVMVDHEGMRWARSLHNGNVVHIQADPPIKAVVKRVTPWRERTQLRLVVGELQSSELRLGQRLKVKMTPPSAEVENSPYPPDIDEPRTPSERVEWFLASIYCTCGVNKNVCTGHFYTLASCNPNGCGLPNATRDELRGMIDKGLTDRQIWDKLTASRGPWMLSPHLLP